MIRLPHKGMGYNSLGKPFGSPYIGLMNRWKGRDFPDATGEPKNTIRDGYREAAMSDEPPKAKTTLVPNSDNDEPASEPSEVFRVEAHSQFRQHRKAEWVIATIVSLVIASAVSVAAYIFGISPIPWTAIAAGLATALLSIPATLAILYMYYRIIRAPTVAYVGLMRQLVATRRLLADEQAKNGDARISGEILEYSTSGKYEKDKPYTIVGMYFSAKIAFVNNSPAKTSIKNFFMVISVADKELISQYAVDGPTIDEKPIWNLGDESEWVYANDGRTFDNLFRSPVMAEHTVTQAGWLQFCFPGIHLDHMYNGKAYVVMVDHKNRHHATEPFVIRPKDLRV